MVGFSGLTSTEEPWSRPGWDLASATVQGKVEKAKLVACVVDGVAYDAAEVWQFDLWET